MVHVRVMTGLGRFQTPASKEHFVPPRLGVLDNYLIVTEVFQNLRSKGIKKTPLWTDHKPPRASGSSK